MKDSEIIKYIYKNNHEKGEVWCEWDFLDWIDFSMIPELLKEDLLNALVKSYEKYILMNYKFYYFRPDYKSMRMIEKFKTTYMNPIIRFREKNKFYKPLKLTCLNYE
jgi:hypothetical protein